MRIFVVVLGLLGVVALTAAPAEAQLCAGAPSFRELPNQIGVSGVFSDDAQGVGGHFGLGGQTLFAGGGLGFLNYDELKSTATTVSGFVGADLAANEGQRVFVCPVGGVGFGVGPDRGPLDVWSFSLEGGVHVGVVASEANELRVVPTFGLAVIYDRLSAKSRNGGNTATSSDGLGNVSVGVGFVMNGNVGITPSLIVPFAAVNNDPIFLLDFTFNFNR